MAAYQMQITGHSSSRFTAFRTHKSTCRNLTPTLSSYIAARLNPVQHTKKNNLIARAEGDDQEFEDRLSRLKTAKGKTPYGQSRRAEAENLSSEDRKTQPKQAKYDFSGEKLHLETPPHRGDLATNIALGTTLLWLPLTFAAIGRAIFIKYRFTDKRLSVITSTPWKSEQLDAAYQEVKDVKTVGRGIGIWGDMVITLQNNDKIELRSLPSFLELKKYILERRDALTNGSLSAVASEARSSSSKGFS